MTCHCSIIYFVQTNLLYFVSKEVENCAGIWDIDALWRILFYHQNGLDSVTTG